MCNCKCNKSLIGWIGLVMCGLFEKANNFGGSGISYSYLRIVDMCGYKRCVLCALWYTLVLGILGTTIGKSFK